MQKLNGKQKYQLAFNHFQKFGPIKMRLIESYFPNLKEAFLASYSELEKAQISPNLIKNFIEWRQSFNLDLVLEELTNENIGIITWHDEEYPKLLLEINAPPPILYYKGNVNILTQKNNYLAIVGSREHSAYSNKIISELIPDLINREIVIVSGLAHGVDTLAHQETVLQKGKTIAERS